MGGPAAETSLDWGDYQPFATRIAGPLRDAPRDAAEDYFARLMAERPARLAALATLAARHQVGLDDDEAAARLGAWVAAALAGAGPAAIGDPMWSGLITDVAL